MRKRLNKAISMLIIILMFGLVITGCTEKKPDTLTQAQKIEDFEYMYKIIEENYPFLEVNKRVNGVDWLGKKDEFMEEIKKCKNDEEFAENLEDILSQLNNRHTHVLNKKHFEYFYCFYGNYINPWFEELSKPEVLKRYGYDVDKGIDKNKIQKDFMVGDNIKTNIIDNNIGYLRIKSFIDYNLESDKDKITSFIDKIKELDGLIIDIRGNSGGTPVFWMEYIVSPLIEEYLSTDYYYFTRGGEFTDKFFNKRNGLKIENAQHLDDLEELPPEVLSDFKYYWKGSMGVVAIDSINFKGKVFLLVDEGVYSAAEAFAIFTKESGFATLIGERTGGDGILDNPALCALPNSGLVFRFSQIMGTTESGVCNEEYKTTPDYIVDAEITDNIQDDKCIQKAIELAKEEKNH